MLAREGRTFPVPRTADIGRALPIAKAPLPARLFEGHVPRVEAPATDRQCSDDRDLITCAWLPLAVASPA